MSSRHSKPHHATQPARRGSSENRALMELHIRNIEGPQVRHVQRERPNRSSQGVGFHSPASSTTRHWRDPENKRASPHRAPLSTSRSPVPRSTRIPRVASPTRERQSQNHVSRGNHLPPTPRDSPEPDRRPLPSHRAPPSVARSPAPPYTPIRRVPSRNGDRPRNTRRSPPLPLSSEASNSSDGSGDTSHSEYMPGSNSDSSADSVGKLVDSSVGSGNESDVSVVSAGTRRDKAAALLQEKAQLQVEAEDRAAALQVEYDKADKKLGRIRAKIVRCKLEGEMNNAEIFSLARRMEGAVVEEDFFSLVTQRDKLTWTIGWQQQKLVSIQKKYKSEYERGEGPKDLYKDN